MYIVPFDALQAAKYLHKNSLTLSLQALNLCFDIQLKEGANGTEKLNLLYCILISVQYLQAVTSKLIYV